MSQSDQSGPLKKDNSLFLIDLLKVSAALLIILHHLSSYGQLAVEAKLALPILMEYLYEYGRYAVQIFLVMAGYLATQSLTRFAKQQFSANLALRIIINRYLRLFAPYTVALVFTIACAWITRFWVQDEFVGQAETLAQLVAHLFFLQGILGLDSISAGVWYVAIDWQLYSVLAILLMSFSSYQALVWLLSVVSVGSLLYFNRSSQYEAYFIYFLGAYSLGVLAYLAKNYSNPKLRSLAKFLLFGLGAMIAIASFQELWARNILAWCVALALFIWGNASYPDVSPNNSDIKKRALQAIAWASPRSYCAFLIHFAFILLANTIYIASGLYVHANGTMAISMMVLVVIASVIASNYLYRWIELPSTQWKV